MPELPEVESVARLLRGHLSTSLSGTVSQVEVFDHKLFATCTAAEAIDRLSGSRFCTIDRHGKYLLCAMERSGCHFWLVVHLRMTGRMQIVGAEGEANRHTRLRIQMSDGSSLLFDDPRRFGQCWLVDDPSSMISKLGPDALTVTSADFEYRLRKYRRQIKPLLLDQDFVAGIGNIYADEILFRSGIHPCCDSSHLTGDQITRLHGFVRSVLAQAVDEKGANIDGVFKAGMFQVAVYGRDGEPCDVCGTPIQKIRLGQRGTHFCPVCQVVGAR